MSTIVESKRKKPTLLLDSFRYIQDKIINTTIYRKCENRSCPGRVKGEPPLRKSVFLKKFDFSISAYSCSPECPLSEYI